MPPRKTLGCAKCRSHPHRDKGFKQKIIETRSGAERWSGRLAAGRQQGGNSASASLKVIGHLRVCDSVPSTLVRTTEGELTRGSVLEKENPFCLHLEGVRARHGRRDPDDLWQEGQGASAPQASCPEPSTPVLACVSLRGQRGACRVGRGQERGGSHQQLRFVEGSL